jgi:hypothetical protein
MKEEITLTSVELLAIRYPARKKTHSLAVNIIDGEIWQPVTDKLYVSDIGRVKKIYQNKKGQEIAHLYRTHIYNGHLYVQSIDIKSRKLSRIVLTAFKPLDDYTDLYALHEDCNPLNCQLSNLRWATLKEIHQHLRENKLGHFKPVKTYLIPCIRSNGKEGYRRVKISPNKVAQIRKLNESGISQSKIAEISGIRQSQVKNIVNGNIRRDG